MISLALTVFYARQSCKPTSIWLSDEINVVVVNVRVVRRWRYHSRAHLRRRAYRLPHVPLILGTLQPCILVELHNIISGINGFGLDGLMVVF